MKKALVLGCSVLVLFFSVLTTVNGENQISYSWLTNMWFQGGGSRTNVFAISEQRLNTNTNDIVGLLLRLEGDFEYSVMGDMSNTLQRVVSVGATITNQHFAALYPLVQADAKYFTQSFLPNYTLEDWSNDVQKAEIPETLMTHGPLFEALWKDGFLAD